MRKKIAVLAAVFVVFFGVGLWFNLQEGLYFDNAFWRAVDDHTFASAGNRISYEKTEGFRLQLAGREMTAELTKLEEDRYRLSFSDGIAVEMTDDLRSGMAVEIGGIVLTGGMEYVVEDVAGLEFAVAAETVREPFYDENGVQIGETAMLLAADGSMIDYQEVYFGHPEWSGPEREEMVLRNGVRLTDEDWQNKRFVNEQGEYLMDADRFMMIETSENCWHSRGYVARFMLEAANGRPERRGGAAPVVMYAILYLVGAVGFLFPEQTAFFGQRWKFQTEPELSDEGLLAAMAGSLLAMGIAIVVLFIPLG